MNEGESLAEKLTRVYLKIRTKREQLSAAFKKEDSALLEQQDKVKQALLDYCEEHGVDSVKTSKGLFYRSVRRVYWTSDWDSLNKFIAEHEVPEFYEKRLCQSAVKQFLEENPDLVPTGLNAKSEYVLSVRKSK